MVCLDMDGTSLHSDGIFTERTGRVLREISRKGIVVAFCSGRRADAMFPHIEGLGFDENVDIPVVACNGAEGFIVNGKKKRKVFDEMLSIEGAKNILSFAKEHCLMAQYYTANSLYACPQSDEQRALMERYARMTGSKHTLCSPDYREAIADDPNPSKILLMTNSPDIFMKSLREQVHDVHRIRASFFLECLAKNCNKGAGLERMCRVVSIPLEACAAFGDADNDIEFVSLAGTGVAMKNARQCLIDVANRTTMWSNDQDGCAREIELLIKEGKLKLMN